MAIPAKRFNILSGETNVATADFLSIKDSNVLNSPAAELKTVKAEVIKFLENNTSTPNIEADIEKAKNIATSTDRVSTDSGGVLKDLTKLTTKELDTYLNGIAKVITSVITANKKPIPLIFENMPLAYKQKIFNFSGSGRLFSDRLYNSQGSTNTPIKSHTTYDTGQFAEAYNSAFGSSGQLIKIDFNKKLVDIVNIVNYSYNELQIYNVFPLLVPDPNADTGSKYGNTHGFIGRALACTINKAALGGNMNGAYDLASYAGGTPGIYPILEYPKITQDITKYYKQIPDSQVRNLANDYATMQNKMHYLDHGFGISKIDSMLAISDRGWFNNDLDAAGTAARDLDITSNLNTNLSPGTYNSSDNEYFKSAAFSIRKGLPEPKLISPHGIWWDKNPVSGSYY